MFTRGHRPQGSKEEADVLKGNQIPFSLKEQTADSSKPKIEIVRMKGGKEVDE